MSFIVRCTSFALSSLMAVGSPALHAAWAPTTYFTTGDTGDSPDVATDAEANAIAVFVDTGLEGVIEASQFDPGTNTWGAPFQISSPQESGKDAPKIGVSQSNNAVVIQRDASKPSIEYSQLNQSGWSSGLIYPQTGTLSEPSIAMAPTGEAVSGWISSSTGVHAQVISGTSFSFPVVLDAATMTTTDPVAVAVNNEGMRALFWLGSNGQIRYSIYNGTAWSDAADLTTNAPNRYPSAGIDASGNIVVAWLNGNAIQAARYIDGVWIPAHKISPEGTAAISRPVTAVDKSGKALVIWLDQNSNISFALLQGPAWAFGTAGKADPTSVYSLTKDDQSNFLATWTYNSGSVHEIRSAYFNQGLGWSATETVASSSLSLNNPFCALSSTNHTGFTVFESGGNTDAAGTFSLLAVPPSPPIQVLGRVKKDRFPCQTDRIHIISWNQTDDPTAVFYRLRQGTHLIGEFPLTGPFRVDLHNRDRKKVETYGVSTVNALGVEGAPNTIELK